MVSKRMRPVWWTVSAVMAVGVVGVLGAVWAFGPRIGIWLVPPSPERYGQDIVRMLDSGLYAHGAEWATARQEALDALASVHSFDEADAALADAVRVAGGHHSRIIPASSSSSDADGGPVLPTVTVDGGIATAVVPEFTGDPTAGQRYADTLAEGLVDADVCGVIVDLRGNGGGDMGPMLAGLAPLLPDGDVSRFVIRDQVTTVRLTDGTVSGGGTTTSTAAGATTLDVPVAVLTDDGTGSSGEQAAIAFHGLDRARSFGLPTAGYASVNQTMTLYSGSTLALAVGETEDRTGARFGDAPIAPDQLSQDPVADATAWLMGQC